MNTAHSVTVSKMELKVTFHPADPKMSLSEAKDKALAAGNVLLDYGDRHDKALLVAHEKGKTVQYALVPELSPPGFTLEQMMAHMKKAGFEVRGEGPRTLDGHRTVLVWEREGF